MNTVTYSIPSISCGHCVHTIEMEIGELEGVQSVKADESLKQATIAFEPPATESNIKQTLAEINYPVSE